MPATTPYGAYFSPLVLLRTAVFGTSDNDLVDRLVNFKYEDHLKKADMAVWTFVDPTGELVDDDRFEPDTVWEFRFGYPGDISPRYKHKVKYYEPVYAEDGTITITVTTMGRATDAMRVMAAKNWGVRPSSDIASEIADRYGFSKRIEVSKDDASEIPWIQPADTSDYEYLHMLASCIDYEFFVEGDVLYYRSREGAFSEPPRHTFYWWGDSTPTLLKSFKPEIKSTKPGKVKSLNTNTRQGSKGASVVTNATVKGRHLGTSKPTQKNLADPDGTTTASDPNSGKHVIDAATGEKKTVTVINLETGAQTQLIRESAAAVHRTADVNSTYVEMQAQAMHRHYLDQLVNGSAEFIGTPRVRAKATFEFLGLSPRLSGFWYCTEVTHTISSGNYSTSANLKRGAYNAPATKRSKGQTTTNTSNTSTSQTQLNQKVKISLETGEQLNAPPSGQAVPR